MSLPKKCLVDTNVPITANLASQPDMGSDVSDACVLACVEALEHVIKKHGLIIDAGDEIFDEYRQQLSMKGQPGMGNAFMKWVNDRRYNPEYCDRVTITRNGDSYQEFPRHDDLNDFDRSDRKFIASANSHADKPPILQATDSKWWGWKDALADVGITVHFLCPEYVEAKYSKKMGT
ncbi:hypothetical protein KQI65_01775 [bacterium]|nr:hypothetical protein [bacterium]